MKILLNDYGGHAFPIQLACQLASKGNSISYSYCASNLTPQGDICAAGRAGVHLAPIDLGRTFEKYKLARRLIDEIDYGVRSAWVIARRKPDAVLLAQLPVVSLLICSLVCRFFGVTSVLWLQDIQSGIVGMELSGPKHVLARIFSGLERRAILSADRVVAIAPSMTTYLREIGLDPERAVVVENWAPLDAMPVGQKLNPWSQSHDLHDKFVFLYSGTMGIKHRPELLVRLCQSLAPHDEVRVVAVSQGRGADWLATKKNELALDNLLLLPYQPFRDLPDVLASADVLVAVLDQSAGSSSVPSKILSYLCAGRSILASLPIENSSAELITDRAAGGLVSTTEQEFVEDALRLLSSAELRSRLGANGRLYAEKAFDIEQIANVFLEILDPDAARADLFPDYEEAAR